MSNRINNLGRDRLLIVALSSLLILLLSFAFAVAGNTLGGTDGSSSQDTFPIKISTSGTIVRMIVAIAFIIGLIYISVWALKKISNGKYSVGGRGKNIEVIDNSYLGQKKGLHIVRAGKKYILIGSSDNSISFLCNLDPEDFREINPSRIADKKGGSFREMLGKLKYNKGNHFFRRANNAQSAS